MTKIEELKAAHEAVKTTEQWRARTVSTDPYRSKVVTAGSLIMAECDGASKDQNSDFIALAHNMMPQLLGAVELLSAALPIIDAYRKVSLGDGDVTAMNIRVLLEELK